MKNYKILIISFLFIVLFCGILFYVIPQLKSKPKVINQTNISSYSPKEINYSNLNYTTLNISEEEFKNLPFYRQIDWLYGWCYPYECEMKNPPVCTSFYLIYCNNPNSKENKYFNNMYLT